MTTLSFTPPSISYDLIVGSHLLEEAIEYAHSLYKKVFILTTKPLAHYIPEKELIILSHDQLFKSRARKEEIEDLLLDKGCDASSVLLVVGGGVLLDVIGFVAATYCRGIAYISIPTTLLAMTDAAIGGKVAVNVERAKNWIGAFHHPVRVYIDLDFLQTLPKNQFVWGFAETLKHSLIASSSFFLFLEENREQILAQSQDVLPHMIKNSCCIKKEIVEQDPYEKRGLRRILNFGHTVGHALENLSGYKLEHGLAVYKGMLIEARMAFLLGYLKESDFRRMEHFIKCLPIDLDLPKKLSIDQLKLDKKGAASFVVLSGIGSVVDFEGAYVTQISQELLTDALRDI